MTHLRSIYFIVCICFTLCFLKLLPFGNIISLLQNYTVLFSCWINFYQFFMYVTLWNLSVEVIEIVNSLAMRKMADHLDENKGNNLVIKR